MLNFSKKVWKSIKKIIFSLFLGHCAPNGSKKKDFLATSELVSVKASSESPHLSGIMKKKKKEQLPNPSALSSSIHGESKFIPIQK